MTFEATLALKLANDARRAATPPRLLSVVGGHVLVDYTHQADAGGGSYSHGVALFAAPEGESHTHVVWTLIYNHEREAFVVESGDYCFSLSQALAAYIRRGGAVS